MLLLELGGETKKNLGQMQHWGFQAVGVEYSGPLGVGEQHKGLEVEKLAGEQLAWAKRQLRLAAQSCSGQAISLWLLGLIL